MTNEQIIDEASEWFVTLRHESADPLTQERFMAWLRRSPEHVRAYLDIVVLWDDLPAIDRERTFDVQALLARARDEGMIASLEAERNEHGRSRVRDGVARRDARAASTGRRFVIAASVALLGLLAGAIGWFQIAGVGLYRTDIGEQRSLKLADGSTVQLNSASRIRVSFSRDERDIDLLEGQALFHVAKDAQRPFVVRSGAASIRAVGTQFDVYRKRGGTIVTVVEGRVAVFEGDERDATAARPTPDGNSRRAPSTILSAGEQIRLDARAVPRPIQADVPAVTAWTQGKLKFKSIPLSAVVDEFNRYNTRRLILDPAAADIPITAVFSSTDTQMLVEFLKHQPEFSIEARPDEIRIRPAAEK
jgi:transmembrane sensor